MTTQELRQIVDNLFHLFEQGKWDEAAKLFAADGRIIGQYGQKVSIMTVEEFMQKAKFGAISKLGKPVYLNRRVVLHGTDGFLEQHTSQLTVGGKVIEVPACLVGKFDDAGAITLVEEYLDPTPLVAALMKLKR